MLFKKMKKIQNWHLVVLTMIFLISSLVFLRLNNIEAVELRRAVVAADESGDTGRIQRAMYALSNFTLNHMNADAFPEIYLKHQYDRAMKQLYDAIQDEAKGKDNVLKKSVEVCERRYSGYSQAYVQCVASEQAKYGPGEDLYAKYPTLDPAAYRHSFRSPIWSADFAGWSVLLTLFFALILISKFVIWIILKIIVKMQFKRT